MKIPGFLSPKHRILLIYIAALLWPSMLILISPSSSIPPSQCSSSLHHVCSDAAHPRAAPPTLALVGAESPCAPLRLHIRNHRWSSEKSLLDNIRVALSLSTLPPPPRHVSAVAVEEEGLVALECGICYAYRMQVRSAPFSCIGLSCVFSFVNLPQSAIPDQACPNSKCSKACAPSPCALCDM